MKRSNVWAWALVLLMSALPALSADAPKDDTKPTTKPVKAPPKPRGETDSTTPVGGTDKRQAAFVTRGKDSKIQLVFLGDSITDFWLSRAKDTWAKYYGDKYDAADFGVSGEHTEHVLGRIQHGLLDDVRPKVVVIMIGTNNIGHSGTETPEWAAAGVKKIVETVHEKLPDTKVLLLGVFPRDKKGSPMRTKVEEINAIIAKLDDGKKTRYLDLGPKFLDAEGNLPKEIMPDGLHPNAKGYEIWAENMQPLLEEMMK